LRDLVALPSINPMGRPLQGPEIFEYQVTDYLKNFFAGLGVPFHVQEVAPKRSNIVAFFEPPEATSTLIFEVHQDTVPTDFMTIPPFGANIENGRLYGRGACDVKGGMAAMLHAFARAVRHKQGRKRLVLACAVDEEFTFLGIQRLVREDMRGAIQGPVRAVVAEPTCLDIVHTHKGAVRWSLHTHGRSCHSSRPELGVNAIYRMGVLLPLVERYAEQLRQTHLHPQLGPATLSVGRIEGGVSVNTVPDRCVIELDRRVLPGEATPAVYSEFEAWLRQYAPASVDFTCSAPWLSCPALPASGSADLVAELGHAIGLVRGKHQVLAVPYGTDASSLAEAGIPSVVFGPGNIDQAHTCDEWVDLEEVEAASEIYYRLAIAS
jgi:acetylornithine deacetylase